MKVNSISNSPNFGARIKMNKAIKHNLLNGSEYSAAGTALSAAGSSVMGSVGNEVGLMNSALHADINHCSFVTTGLGYIGSAFASMADAFKCFKTAVKESVKKIPS